MTDAHPPTAPASTQLWVDQADLAHTRLHTVACDAAALQDGQALLAIRKLALTANNITYAHLGVRFRYWDAFPAGLDSSDTRWGIVPAWGFAEVLASRSGALQVGELLYGFLPTASHWIIQPGRADASAVFDLTEPRRTLEAVYNRYARCATDPGYSATGEDWQALYRPLLSTAFLLEHHLRTQAWFGAEQLLFTSASSKTAQASAWLLRASGCALIGLTAPARRAAVERLGCYDRVLGYDEIESIAPERPCAYLDFAGDGEIRARLHRHFGARLRHASLIGAAHGVLSAPAANGGVEPVVFFAPAVARALAGEWGGAVLGARIAECEQALRSKLLPPSIQQHRGMPALQTLYLDLLQGRSALEAGHIWMP